MNHRYTLEPYSGRGSRHTCPKCQHRFTTFKFYIDTKTGEPLAEHVGRCDREEQCGYHYTPREYFKACPNNKPTQSASMKPQPVIRHFDLIPSRYVSASLRGNRPNNFMQFLGKLFGEEKAAMLANKYNIGTARHWAGGVIFWQMDIIGRIRTGKDDADNAANGRRVKEPFNHIAWVHRLLMQRADKLRSAEGEVRREELNNTSATGATHSGFNLKQCLFGEHLLQLNPFGTVAIAESEKTAIIASVYYPKYIWLAAGSLDGLTADKCKVLADRTVILFPDINGYAKWHKKAHELNLRIPSATFKVDNTLFNNATPADRQRGIDIADLWIDEQLEEWGEER